MKTCQTHLSLSLPIRDIICSFVNLKLISACAGSPKQWSKYSTIFLGLHRTPLRHRFCTTHVPQRTPPSQSAPLLAIQNPPSSSLLDMGVLLSIVAAATNCIKRSRREKKAKETRAASDPAQEASTASQPYSRKQGNAVEGSSGEHPASAPPLSQGSREELDIALTAQVERDVAVEAPLPAPAPPAAATP